MPHTSTPRKPGLMARLRRAAGFSQPAQAKTAQLPAGNYFHSYLQPAGKPVWTPRDYTRFADEAYIRNVIANRSITTIATGAASVPLSLFKLNLVGERKELLRHPVLSLLAQPNPAQHHSDFWESVVQYRLISGNAYILAVGPRGEAPKELHILRPDRVAVIAGRGGMPGGYRYTLGDRYTDYPVDSVSGRSRILHLKCFHPLDDWYGMSPIEAAAYSIDQHNQAGAWNQALLQNGAKPSGALVVRGTESGGALSEDQYWRIKQQIDDQFSGPANAGRPILLEGGLDWKEMSLTPKDMDFIDAKHSSARDIALAFGVPPQLLGIPGDNTYSNLAEARLALWEQTILPLVFNLVEALNNWLLPMFGGDLLLEADTHNISALSLRQEKLWERIEKASFLTQEEKRALAGYGDVNK